MGSILLKNPMRVFDGKTLALWKVGNFLDSRERPLLTISALNPSQFAVRCVSPVFSAAISTRLGKRVRVERELTEPTFVGMRLIVLIGQMVQWTDSAIALTILLNVRTGAERNGICDGDQ
jgi:hypothetical protein